MNKRSPSPRGGPIDDDAAAWIARCDAGLTETEELEFAAWRAADARHPEALARFDAMWSALGRPRRTGAAVALTTELGKLSHRRRRRRMAVAGAGCAVLLVAGLAMRTLSVPTPGVHDRAAPPIVLLPERQILPDGSVVEFSRGTEIAIEFTAAIRRVALKRGEAHFQVVKNAARPFVVNAAGFDVRAVGTAFAVQLGRKEIEVLVTAGRVAVLREIRGQMAEGRGQTAEIGTGIHDSRTDGAGSLPSVVSRLSSEILVDAGNRVVMDVAPTAAASLPSPVLPMGPSDMAERLAWRGPRVEFSGTPLADVVAVINRYNQVQFVIDDPRLGSTALSGLFRADDADAFVRMLEAGFGVRSERRGNRIFLRGSP